MDSRRRHAVLLALAIAWTAFVLLKAAPTWLPGAGFVRELASQVTGAGSPGAGTLYALGHHGGMLFRVSVLHAAQVALGAGVVAWLVPAARPGWLVLWAAGLPAMSLAMLGWGLAGVLFPSTAVLGTLLLGVGSALAAHRRRRIPPLALPWSGAGDAWTLALWAVSALALLVLGGLAVAPDTSWDAVVYHLRLPAFFAAEHRIFHVATNHFSAFPLAAEMQGAFLMLLGGLDRMGGGEAAKLYHLSCALVSALAAGEAARRIVGGAGDGRGEAAEPGRGPAGFAGALAVALVLLAPLTGTIAVRAYNDYLQSALAGVALAVLLRGGAGSLVLGGLVAGTALSAKYTGVFVLLPLAFLLFRRDWRPYALASACFAPWLAKNLFLTGNPVAPFLSGVFGSPADAAYQYSHYAGSVSGMSLNIGALGAAFSGLMSEGSGEMLTELLVVLPVLLFAFTPRGEPFRKTAMFFCAFLVPWYLLVPSARFFATGLAPLSALAAAGFVSASAGRGSWTRWALGAVLALNMVRLPVAHLTLFNPLPFILGKETVEEYLTRTLYPAPYYEPLAREANGKLPPGARLLVMIDIKAHYVWRRVSHDFQYINPGLYLRWLREGGGTVDGLARRLRREGITHILVVYQRTRDVGRHYSWEGGELATTAEFLASRTRIIMASGGAEVLEILPAPAPRRDLDSYGWLLFVHPENLMLERREDEAVSILRETMRRAPWLVATRAYLGMALARQEKYGEAMPLLAAASRDGNATAPFASFALAQIWLKKGDATRAEQALRASIRMQPRFADAHSELGRLLARRGKYAEALVELRSAARLLPESAQYARNVAELERRMGAAAP